MFALDDEDEDDEDEEDEEVDEGDKLVPPFERLPLLLLLLEEPAAPVDEQLGPAPINGAGMLTIHTLLSFLFCVSFNNTIEFFFSEIIIYINSK